MKKINIINQNSYQLAQQEIKVWSNLKHPNIVRYYHCFMEQNQFCILMELVDGPNFEQFFSKNTNLPESFIMNLFSQLLSAIKYCYNHSVLHRDIKLQNILLTPNFQIKLADFGISRIINPSMNYFAQAQIGTPFFMAFNYI
jgi:serine/threonine protein kinase